MPRKIYIATCSVYGCEECGDEYHVVAAGFNKSKIELLGKLHCDENDAYLDRKKNAKIVHVHRCSIDIEELDLIED